nr:NB-ARC domains-containing protein [Tanacetum cinerariifolium]
KLSIWSISGLSDEVWRGVMDYLGAVEELSIGNSNEIRYLWESEAKASKVLVNLRTLRVSDCSKLKFPPSLVDLRLWGGSAEEDDVSSGSQLSHMLPSSLTKLALCFFGKLESVSMGLQHLTSLQHLRISSCPKIQDLPETLLPSLLTLRIWRCPDNLKEKISRRGSYWLFVSYIPYMDIS